MIRSGCINADVNLVALPCQANTRENRVLGIFGHNREGVARMEGNAQ